MWIGLDRFAECDPQDRFILHIPNWFGVQSIILAHLTPGQSHRYLRTCVYLLLDARDLLLSATAFRIQYVGAGFSVATPPVQPALPIAAGQGGGDWDDITFSDIPESSEEEPSIQGASEAVPSHAMEGQDLN